MNNRKKLVILFSSICALLAVSTALTFAWFLEGTDLFVDNVCITFKGDKDLRISASDDVTTFKESISKEDLKRVDAFIPVSSMYSYNWTNIKAETPMFQAGYTTTNENPTTSQAISGFFSQDIYLYSKSDDFYATIDKDTFEVVADKERNAQIAVTLRSKFPNLSDYEIQTYLDQIEKSVRVSILVPDQEYYQYVIIDPYKEQETLFGGVMDLNDDGFYDAYTKQNQIYEVVYGDLNDRSKIIYDSTSSGDSEIEGPKTCFNAKHKNGVRPFNPEASEANGLVIAKEQSLTPEQAEYELGIPIFAEEPTKIVLSIYLEGWDLDNTNLAMYAAFSVGLKFKISETKGEL